MKRDEDTRGALLAAWVKGSEVRLLGADSLDQVRADFIHLQRAMKAAIGVAASTREFEAGMRARAGRYAEGSPPYARFRGIADTLANAADELERALAAAVKLPDGTVPDHPPPGRVQPGEPGGEHGERTG